MCTILPPSHETVNVTYVKTIRYGHYGMNERKETVTEKGFYSNLFNNFSIPHEWRMFNGCLLPHGFNSTKLKIEDVIQWELIPE